MFLIQVENYFVIYSPEFFFSIFSLSGSSTGLLVAACESCVSHLPRYIIYRYYLLLVAVFENQGGGGCNSVAWAFILFHFAMQGEWECRKVYFLTSSSFE